MVEEMKLNFPFVLPEAVTHGRSDKEAAKVKLILKEAHHEHIERQKHLDDFVRQEMEKLNATYTVDHQIRAIWNTSELWNRKVMKWLEEEKKARMTSTAELEKLKSKNPLAELLLETSVTESEPISQEKGEEGRGEDEEEVESEEEERLIIKRRRGKQVVDEELIREEEQRIDLTKLDIPIIPELAAEDEARNEGQAEGGD